MYVIRLIFWILISFCWMKILTKTGQKGWKAFIPFYRDYMRFGVAGKKWLYFPSLFLSVLKTAAQLIYSALAALNLADSLLEDIRLDLDISFFFWLKLIFTLSVFAIEIWIGIRTAQRFNKTRNFGIGLGILPVIFAPILAFDDSVYCENKKESEV